MLKKYEIIYNILIPLKLNFIFSKYKVNLFIEHF